MPASPKRATSKGKKVDQDDLLLDARIENFKVDYPASLLLAFGLATAFLPCYLAHGFYGLDWLSLINLPFFAIAVGGTGHLLSRAYSIMIETEFLKRQRHYSETKTEQDAAVLRQLRLQVSVGYAIFFVNAVFAVACTLVQGYLLRQLDARVSLLAAPTAVAGVLFVIANKNEEARQRKIGRE